jgi:hypothetical protein
MIRALLRRPCRSAAVVLSALLASLLACGASAQQVEGTGIRPERTDKSVAIPALEIIAFDFLLNHYNRRFSGSSDYDVSGASIRRNLRGPWVVDNDPFNVNQFAHPYQGSLYHGAARSTGLSYWEAAALTFAGSAWWEITGEQTPPSKNDQIASGIAGSFLGEPLFRMARLMLKDRGDVPYRWRQWGAALISPPVGLNRLMFGNRFDGAFDDHDPVYYGRLSLGAKHATRNENAVAADEIKRNDAEADFALDYGLPGQPGYTYRRPFDYFSLRAVVSSANGVENLSTRGLLFGTDYAIGDKLRGIWGLYGNYDYLAPQMFRMSSTALSLGSTAQWWVSKSVALQGTALAGLGYSAASSGRGDATNRDNHYGMAPRVGLALRAIVGDRFAADVSAQRTLLGSIANRAAGRDDISRADAALNWRIHKRHAIGIKYVWSHRKATFPTSGDRTQTLGMVGLYYTLLGLDHFGTVDWRTARD